MTSPAPERVFGTGLQRTLLNVDAQTMERSRNSRRFTAMAIVLAIAGVGCGGSGTAGPAKVSNDVDTPTFEPSVGSGSGWSPSWTPTSQGARSESTNAAVTRVVDGDTVEVRFRGRTIDVRLIGIDTPETVDPTQPVGCYGKAASHFTTARLSGERVRLEFDVERTDRYGRTLAYVWIGGRLFNEVLVRQGFASVSTYPPNVTYVDRFLVAQRVAREQERGLWGGCPAADDGGGGRTCDPSYPDLCIPPPPPDLDCGDVAFHAFRVRGSDPHNVDADRNGFGCES
jgi:micrococcal nuclease